MGSMLKFETDRRELVRERRTARIERKQQRRQAREHKRSQTSESLPRLSAAQRLAEQQVRRELDRVVDDALERHDGVPTSEAPDNATRATYTVGVPAIAPSPQPVAVPRRGSTVAGAVRAPSSSKQRVSRRERDIAEFRERRQRTATAARKEARARIRRVGETAAVADALAAVGDPGASPWRTERETLERALGYEHSEDVAVAARRALWSVGRDATVTSRRATRDRELAQAVCVAYAIIARLPRTAIRAAQQARRKQRIAEFLERRNEIMTLTLEEARERIARLGEEQAVCDALRALAHSQAAPWSQQRERLSEAIASRGIRDVGSAARQACRDISADAARTSRRAPDPDMAQAVAVAYALIAEAPWATVRGARAERNRPVKGRLRPFWR